MSKDLELFKFARLYLGQTNWENLRKTTQSELALFQKFPLSMKQSYIVYGNAGGGEAVGRRNNTIWSEKWMV